MFAAGITRRMVAKQAITLERDEISTLIPSLLRVIKTSDEQFRALLSESSIGVKGDHYSPPNQVIVRIPYAKDPSGGHGIPLTELASGTVIMWELAVRVATTLGATLDTVEHRRPPEVIVSPGSTEYVFGGGTLMASAVAFVVAAYAGMLPAEAARLSLVGGAFLSSFGVISLATQWYKTVNEARSLSSKSRLNDAQTELTRVKTKVTRLQLAKARRELEPASRLVAPAIVTAEARRFGIDAALGTHLLNQVLPAYSQLSHTHSGITAAPAGSRGKAAGA